MDKISVQKKTGTDFDKKKLIKNPFLKIYIFL